MDDILVIAAENPRWEYNQLEGSLSACDDDPLKLEKGKDGIFLETKLFCEGNRIHFRLKNDNETETKIWRYQHYKSHGSNTTKNAVLKGCLQKVQRMASNRLQLHQSALAKIAEFHRLEYPWNSINGACKYLAMRTRNPIWFDIRDDAHLKFIENPTIRTQRR
jgi:hypothetical protein